MSLQVPVHQAGRIHSALFLPVFFGRAEYNYKDRIMPILGLRTDASSRFGKDHRWGTFWSVGVMWNAKQEHFLKACDWLHNAQVVVEYRYVG